MAVEFGGGTADNWVAYGIALHENERYPEAIEAFDRAMKLKPDSDDAARWREQSARRLLKEVG
jgi:tetratricopeptide (TPR) repeat protein